MKAQFIVTIKGKWKHNDDWATHAIAERELRMAAKVEFDGLAEVTVKRYFAAPAVAQPTVAQAGEAVAPAMWVLYTGHGNHVRHTPPEGDFADKWVPLYRAHQPATPSATAEVSDEAIFQAMRPIMFDIDAGYACDIWPAKVIAAGRAAIAATNPGATA